MPVPAKAIPTLKPEDKRRFFDKVSPPNENGCKLWTASKTSRGYGMFGIGAGRYFLANRIAWVIEFGNTIGDFLVCHSCDNPSCVNPKHLFLGSNQDNMDDRNKKNRTANLKGENHGCCVLTKDLILEIRNSYIPKIMDQRALAKKYGVSQAHIGRILRRKVWSHI